MSDSGSTHSHKTPGGGDTADCSADSADSAAATAALPARIGRYRVERIIGSGGFGVVYLAHDDLLERPVAVKVPHPRVIPRPGDAAAYLAEARTVASLDHPNIVPVHDVGGSFEVPCYVVSKFIDGTDLATRLRAARPSLREAVDVLIAVAEAAHHAHQQGFVHRDIKPGNILLDRLGKPYLADFGLALRDRDAGQHHRYAGTPAYMSPEQARGEGHRVDARSDVFSLGVVLYELLAGRRPFAADSQQELLHQVNTREVCPPRVIDEGIPPELERICLKALSKRAVDRYPTALALADDLRLAMDAPGPGRPAQGRVVPKGLRSFGTDDADFFLDLIPGPRDRHGLPESIRVWKAAVEQADPDQTFPVGLLYGPSGCGKSSLVKAGLLPRLAPHVKAVYLEATPDLEARLLHRLGRVCPEAGGAPDLAAATAAIRLGGLPGDKVLIVIDQFEQWLHARRDGTGDALARALRQCDGGRLQCLVTVRDDFWMMAARFMRELEVQVTEGQNAAAVDLFDLPHARKVLEAFGRAYGALPAPGRDLSPDQAAFLDRAVAELAHDGRVIPVRLALFADMIKRSPWKGDLLGDLGGAVGVGVTFLEENFAAATAPPEHRQHHQAVRAVLGALLPGAGTDIKGHARTRLELLEASGYAKTPDDFARLMRILLVETRLLTPVAADPGAGDSGSQSGSHSSLQVGEQAYQLTHDYLIPSVRDWLTRKQMETRRGRAELRLAERAGQWHARHEVRQLPSMTEWLAIRLWTRRRTWTDTERDVMRAADRRYAAVAGWALAVVVLVTMTGLIIRGRVIEDRDDSRADGLVRRLLDADAEEVPKVVAELDDYRRWANPALARVVADPTETRPRQLRARLGLLPVDPGQVDDLRDRLLVADPRDFPVIRDALAPHGGALAAGLWGAFAADGDDPARRFRAAAALAAFDPASARWPAAAPWVADQLSAQPALVRTRWVDALRPVAEKLTPALVALVGDRARPAAAVAAAEILGDYAAARPDVLADALGQAGPDSFPHLFAPLRARPDRACAALTAALDAPGPADPNATAARRANLVIALLRAGDGNRLWPLLKASPDPRVRSYLIDRLALPGGDPMPLVARLAAEPDDTTRAALWLGLGGFDDRALPPDRRAALTPAVLKAYRDDDSAAVHAAAWWLLGKWGARGLTARDQPAERKGWYVNDAGQTMIRITGPVQFTMGTPPDEPGYWVEERAHPAHVEYSFDISMTEVTVGQYRRFLDVVGRPAPAEHARVPADAAATRLTWFDAAEYCNWLSEAEGIPRDQWCYAPNAGGKYADGMRLVGGYRRLRGYRLPTEVEWEYACRGGTTTRCCYGDADDLLPRYAWFAGNAADDPGPVARLLPNGFGLFDVHGNASEWCQDALRPYPITETPAAEDVRQGDNRAARGGHVHSYANMIRSGKRFSDRPILAAGGGFRLARGNP